MEKRTILAIALSLVVLLGWQFFFPPVKPDIRTITKVTDSTEKTTTKESVVSKVDRREREVKAAAVKPKEVKPVVGQLAANSVDKKPPVGRQLVIDSSIYRCVINTAGGVVQKFTLKKYHRDITPNSPLLEMVSVVDQGYYPLSGRITLDAQIIADRRFLYRLENEAQLATQIQLKDKPLTVKMRAPLTTGMTVVKKYVFYPDEYYFDLQYLIVDPQGQPVQVKAASLFWAYESLPNVKKKRYVYTGPMAYVDGKLFKQSKKQKNIKRLELDGRVNWIGYSDKYFLAAIMPSKIADVSKTTGIIEKPVDRIVETGLQLASPETFRVFVGPKETSYLKKFNLDLEKSVEFGWFGIIARPLVQMLNFFQRYLHNYGLAIILLTVLIKLVFYPLSQKSYQSMSKMKEIQPKLAKIKEKFKDDKARQQKEMMDLYRTHKVNPFGGCLPIVVQIPVFFALYRGLMVAIELRHAPFFLWIQDLSAPDPYYVTPILMGVTMFLQQKMTPSTGDAMQAKLMLFMPIIFTFMFLNFPSGLVLYWLVNNILSIAQQYMVMRKVKIS